MPLDYLSCFAVVLRGILGKVDTCQTDYSIHSKLRIFLYSEVVRGSTTFKLIKGLTKVKEKCDIFVISFIYFVPISQKISVINRNGTCFFYINQTSGVCLVCAHAITHINWRRPSYTYMKLYIKVIYITL